MKNTRRKPKKPETFTAAVKRAMSMLDDGEPGDAVKLMGKILRTVSGKVGKLIEKAKDEADIGSPERAETLLWMVLYEIGYPVSAVIADSSPENDERLLSGCEPSCRKCKSRETHLMRHCAKCGHVEEEST